MKSKKKDNTPQITDPQAIAALQQKAEAEAAKGKKGAAGKLAGLDKKKKKGKSEVSNRNLFGKEKFIRNLNFKGKFKPTKAAKKSLKTVIYIDQDAKLIKFVSNKGDSGKLTIESKPFESRLFDREFFTVFKNILSEYGKSHSAYAGKNATAVLVLPDGFIASDCISIPSVASSKKEKLINVAIDSRFKNFDKIKVNYYSVFSNKQTTFYEISTINEEFYNLLTTSCSGSNLFADVVTYAGSATVNALLSHNNKLKSSSFIFADIKDGSSRLCYVINGSCMGSVTLPFGREILEEKNVVAENMLFDHTVAELAVLNAKEKAKAKQLTMAAATTTEADENLAEGVEAFGGTADAPVVNATVYKTLPKKTPRVLPKFMQRPEPQTEEEMVCENFRIFEKYILEYVRANKQYNFNDNLQSVIINMPEEYAFVLDKVNENIPENKITFKLADLGKIDATAKDNLEIYGGLVSASLNLQNNF